MKKITGSIVGDGELADSASPELASIRRHMRATESKVRDILQKLISSSQAKYLQESIITMRSGRYVVPVKSEHKNEIPGLVHDLSGSGSRGLSRSSFQDSRVTPRPSRMASSLARIRAFWGPSSRWSYPSRWSTE